MEPIYSTKPIPSFPNDSWTRVEIFSKAYDRLPSEKGDRLDQKCLDRFCERFEKGEIQTTTVDLKKVYDAIKAGLVNLT